MVGSYFTRNLYWVWHNLLLGLAFLIAIIYAFFPWLSQLEQISIIVMPALYLPLSSSFVETDIRLLECCDNCGGTVDNRGWIAPAQD
ncbi:hypothetical protein B0H14DRAFT_1397547 [Mycena olivaceomarginata]|nr:hypothetical protein B0H14DRAFT_1397547 [Mycena olivaceomarginata]